MNTWLSLSAAHYAALVLIAVLGYSAIQRMRTFSQNRALFWANVIVPITLFTSLPPIYYWLDPLLGNVNIVNLLAHIGVIVAGWLASRALGQVVTAFRGENFKTGWFSPVWLLLIVFVLIVCFVQLGLGNSNRGLDNRSDSLLYGVYHGVTYLGFAFAAPYVVPRLKELTQAARVIRHKVQFGLFYIGYFTASIATVLHVISPLASQVHGVREIFVYSTGFVVTLAFVMVTLDKKSLSQPQM